MADDRLRDGRRIAELLASEVDALETGRLARLSVVDADRDAEPSAEGTFAYGIELAPAPDAEDGTAEAGPTTLAEASLHPDRVRLDVLRGAEAAADAARDAGLDAEAGDPLRVFVADGAEVKRALGVLSAAAG